MNPRYRDLIKHSGIYGLGQLLGRLASIVMLPVHTRYLTPADYGTIAILDLTATVLAVLVSAGMSPALARFHKDATTPDEESAVWWTGLAVVGLVSGLVLLPAIIFRSAVASFTLGPQEARGGFYVALSLATLWCSVLSQVALVYFRVRMWSWLNVGMSMTGLLFNIGLNLYLLIVLDWGVTGILTGNLITMALFGAIRLGMVMRSCGRFRFDRQMSWSLTRFGAPIVVTMALATVMHQADRYLLRLFVDLDSVGVYALAYQMAQGVNALILLPFSAVWSVTLYDVARQTDARQAFGRVFEYFVYVVLLVMFGVSLFVEPLLRLFATEAYAAAAQLVPILCLAFVFFSLDEHFQVPALLAKKTMSLIPANAAGAIANIGLNLLLIPHFGVVGAAWTSVATYAVFSGINLLRGRQIDRYDYPLGRCALVLGGMIVSLLVARSLAAVHDTAAWMIGVPATIWLGWVAFLGYPAFRQFAQIPKVQAEV